MFKFIRYDKKNEDHKELLEKMLDDEEIRENVNSIYSITNLTYVVSKDNTNIGLFKIVTEMNNTYSFDLAILKEYRNKGYGTLITKEAIDIIDDSGLILIRTEHKNFSAIKAALHSGFNYDCDKTEKSIEEGMNYVVLSLKK